MNVINFNNVRLPWMHAPYPFYHTGRYLEEHMYDTYLKNMVKYDAIGFTYIPIFWTSAYMAGIDLQPYIDALPKTNRYFAVSQHDDAIKEKLPEGTVVFSAGGNSGGIPIPLVSSPMPLGHIKSQDKIHLASFIGSDTHPIRRDIVHHYGDDSDIFIKIKLWSFDVSGSDQTEFIYTTMRSKFALCPRGYGAQSFRTYEAMQMGAVPVYIFDGKPWLPFNDIVPWSEFAVVVHRDHMAHLKDTLEEISDEKYEQMRETGKMMIEKYFTIPGTCDTIFDILKTQ